MTPEELEAAQLAAADMLAALLMVQSVADGYEAGKRGAEHPHSYTEWKAAVDAAIEKATGGKRPNASLSGGRRPSA